MVVENTERRDVVPHIAAAPRGHAGRRETLFPIPRVRGIFDRGVAARRATTGARGIREITTSALRSKGSAENA